MHLIFVDPKSTSPEKIADVLRRQGCNVSVAAISADEKILLEQVKSYIKAHNESTVVVAYDDELDSGGKSDQAGLAEEITRRQVDLEQRERHLRAVIDAEPECVKLLDRDGNLLEMNPAGLTMIEAESFSQVDHHCVYPLVNDEFRESFRHMTEEVFQGKPAILEFKITGLKGTERWLETHASPFRSEAGDIVALLGITRDITLRKQATDALFNSSLRLKLATEAANIGLWDWDLELNQVYYSKEWKRQIGYDDHEISHDFREWQDRVHPDDLAFLQKKIESYLANPTNPYEIEFRFRHRNGSYLWIFAQADVIRDSTGKVVRMLGCHVDITRRKEYETELIAGEERLRLALESAQMATFTWNQTEDHLDHSIRFRELWGFQDESQTTCWSDCLARIHAEDIAKVTEWVDRAQDHPSFVSEFRISTDDQTTKWLLMAGKVELGPSHERVVRGVVTDISDRKQTQLRLQERENLLSQIQRIAGIGSWVWDMPQGTITWTEEMYRIFDVDADVYQPSPEHNRSLPHPDDRHILSNWMASALKGENPGAIEFRRVDRKGRVRTVRGQGEITMDRDGNPLLGMGTAQDITELRHHTNELVTRDRVLSSLAEGTTALLKATHWRHGLNDLLGRLGAAAKASRVYVFQRHGPDDRPLISQQAEWVAQGVEPQIDNPELQNLDLASAGFGEWLALMTSGQPVISAVEDRPESERALLASQGILSLAVFPITVSDSWWGFIGFDDCGGERLWSSAEANTLKAVAGVLSSVIERETVLRQLNESQETFSKAFKSTSAPLAITTMDGKFGEVNAAFCRSFGFDQNEVIGRSAVELGLLSQAERNQLIELLNAAGGSVQDHEIRMRRKDGDHRDIIYSVTTIALKGQPHRLYSGIDITERKKAEAELERREEYFRTLIEYGSDLITVIDANGSISYLSPSVSRILGYEQGDLIGKCVFDYIHKDDLALTNNAIRRVLNHRTKHIPTVHRLKHQDGSWRTLQSIGRRIEGQDAEVTMVINSRDISETRELERQYLQAQKMEAIGQLAGGVAHDFNNILAAIMMQVELMGCRNDLDDDTRSGLRDLNLYAERAANLTRQLLLFSRRQVMQQQDLDLNGLVTSLSKMIQRIIGADVRLRLQLSPSPLWIRADAGMLDQVLMNLCVNARDAMPNGGRLLVETGTHDAEAPIHQIPEELGAGTCHWLRVIDHGVGIAADVLPRIFDPFFTTKEPGKGTGLGLATVFGIVEQHGGWIGVDQVEPAGTAFTIYVPALTMNSMDAPKGVPDSVFAGASGVVLLVEDDPAVQMLTQAILKRNGYRVATASNGAEALALWELHQNQIDLLFTDLVMPGGLSGHQLAKRLLTEKPSLKVIYCSGYSPDIAGKDLDLNSGENFVQKPFLPSHLLKTVRNVLES